ncbi:MAG TPA: Flp pilus assembly protein CpaB [Lentisphaeria bacterium]|nr:MAG: Flp pilus assembly protein CpaB [Lentisphaerae bacterium GWF2_49_21]HBC86906.1 Flp pilus assembly protein CpaB [Lentisphaeria bacterium]
MNKNVKNVLPVAAAIVLGIISVIAINRYITAKTTVVQEKKVRIIIAAQQIDEMQIISLAQLETKEIQESSASDINIVVPVSDDLSKLSIEINNLKTMIAGRQAKRSITAGAPILWSDLKEAEVQSLSDIIEKDKRAVTISVDALSGVGFNIYPGDRVDILATKDAGCGGAAVNLLALNSATVKDMLDTSARNPELLAQAQQEKSKTFILMQNVLVLAVGQNYSTFMTSKSANTTYSNITFEVSIQEAVMLTHARSNASLSLVLRSPTGTDRLPADKIFEVDCEGIKGKLATELDKARAETSLKPAEKTKTGAPAPLKQAPK